MMMREALHQDLLQLHLRGMANVLDEELNRAEREASPNAEFLSRLLAAQVAHQRERSLAHRIKEAKLPWQWTLETFPFHCQPSIDRAQIRALASLDFIARQENILLIGPPGTGKTGIALGLLRQACLNGYAGRYYNAQTLLDDLYGSLADRSSTKLITQLARHQPLLIDELGYLTLKSEQSNAFFSLMDRRYARSSTIITTNLEPEAWYPLFGNKHLVDALLDRFMHRCIIIRISGASLRTNGQPDLDNNVQAPTAASAKPTNKTSKAKQS